MNWRKLKEHEESLYLKCRHQKMNNKEKYPDRRWADQKIGNEQNIKMVKYRLGDGSVGKVFATQAQGPEFKAPEPMERWV